MDKSRPSRSGIARHAQCDFCNNVAIRYFVPKDENGNPLIEHPIWMPQRFCGRCFEMLDANRVLHGIPDPSRIEVTASELTCLEVLFE